MQQTEEHKKHVVRNCPHEGLVELLKTLPYGPNEFSITLNAYGLVKPASYVHDKLPEYTAACFKKGVIPFSHIKMGYDSNVDLFVPCTADILYIPDHGLGQYAIQSLLKGGKIASFEFSVEGGWYAPKAFNLFQRDLLDSLIKDEYELQKGYAWRWHNDQAVDGINFHQGVVEFSLVASNECVTYRNAFIKKYSSKPAENTGNKAVNGTAEITHL